MSTETETVEDTQEAEVAEVSFLEQALVQPNRPPAMKPRNC